MIFAIICNGELLRHDRPDDAIREIEGMIYSKSINKADIEAYRYQYQVISVQMKAGSLNIRIYAEGDPGNGFVPVQAVLEDVYFHQISGKMDVITL